MVRGVLLDIHGVLINYNVNGSEAIPGSIEAIQKLLFTALGYSRLLCDISLHSSPLLTIFITRNHSFQFSRTHSYFYTPHLPLLSTYRSLLWFIAFNYSLSLPFYTLLKFRISPLLDTLSHSSPKEFTTLFQFESNILNKYLEQIS